MKRLAVALGTTLASLAFAGGAQGMACVNHAGSSGGMFCQPPWGHTYKTIQEGVNNDTLVLVKADGPYVEAVNVPYGVTVNAEGPLGTAPVQIEGVVKLGTNDSLERLHFATCPERGNTTGVEFVATTFAPGCQDKLGTPTPRPLDGVGGYEDGLPPWNYKIEANYPDTDKAAWVMNGPCAPPPYIPPNPCLSYVGEWEPDPLSP